MPDETPTAASLTAPRTRRGWVLIAALMAVFMAAVESTIIATAMPTIVGLLGGLDLLSWVFAAYLLSQAVTIPINGRLADLYGRKRVLIVGYISSVFGIAALVGPLLGAFLVQQVEWQTVFWINLPVGFASIGILAVA